MKHLPWNKPGQFYKGNLHTHSTRSDGRLSPEQVCGFYREAGYDFLALTDHFLSQYGWPMTDTRPYRDARFTTLIGAELHAARTEFNDLWHILAVGLPLGFAPPAADEDGPQLTARALAAGAYVSVAHPVWYTLSEADVRSLGQDVHSIETFNGTSIDHNDRPDSWSMLDLMLNRGYRYWALATDDAHFHPKRHDMAVGWCHVRAEALDPDALLAALKDGAYYSSTGPLIHDLRLEAGRRVVVRCSPAERVFLLGPGPNSRTVDGIGLCEASFVVPDSWPFFRITVRDAHGGRAWSNPVWFD